MRTLPAAGVLILALLCGTPAPGLADDKVPSIRDGTRLLAEGDKLADKGQYTDTVIRYKRAFEIILPHLRRIPFLHEVKRDVTKREDLKAMLLKELDEDMTPEEFRANEMAMKAFGLLPRDYRPQGGPGAGLLGGDRRLLRPQDQDDAPDRGAQEARAEEEAGPARAALRQGWRVRQGREQVGHRPRADPRPGRSALRPGRPPEGRQEGRRPLDGALGPDRGRGHPDDDRRQHGRLGGLGDREAPRREPRLDLQDALAVPAVHGRRHEPAQGPGDHLRVDDLPLFPGCRLLRQADQRRRMEGDRRGLSQPPANPPSRSSTRRNTWPARTGRWRSTWAA